MVFLAHLVLILLATTLAGHYCGRIGLPVVLGQLLVGVIIGPAVLGLVSGTNFIHDMSELGVIILMFLAGLESDLTLLRRYFIPSALVAIMGILVPALSSTAVALAFGLSTMESIFIGVLFAATSVSISVAVMKELGVLSGKGGSTILGAAVIDDVVAVILLSVLVSVIGHSKESIVSLGLTLVVQLSYFIGIFFVVRYVAPLLAHLGKQLFLPVGSTLLAMILCFGMAYIADLAGLSAVIGAFFAGIAIGQTSVRHEVNHSVESIGYAIFIPVFFVSIGLNMRFDGISSQIGLLVVMSIVAVLSKFLGAGYGAKLAKFSKGESSFVGAGMISRGEMALIVAQVGYQSKLIQSDTYSALVMVVIITTLVAPFILKVTAQHLPKE
ncbi:cation:proton antiporter [Streptococcus sciuri]|uniref:Cation:proton antiporter n=1 Tax=Streptococcus sciuri TaxID=2973939 RepID=A0ABT2F7R8_9STRE|nr:cation:proton antiporter [Streptococcus sciuri]MCS4488435.1 cation:proton antiporter [Streptococcus sciuri]